MTIYTPTRRQILQGASAIAAAGSIGLLRPPCAEAAPPLVITDAGGEWHAAAQAAFYTPYQQQGVALQVGTRPSLALGQIKAMVDAHNVQWNITSVADYLIYRAGKSGLLEPIRYDGLNTTGMLKDALMPYGIASDAYATIMSYSTQKWPAGRGPKNWAEFWDVKKFPGRRSMSGIGYGPLEFALLADGVPPEKIYPIDVKRALAKMSEIRPHIDVWWTTGAQQGQLMQDGEVDLIQGWNGRLTAGISHGAPFHLEWGQGMYQWEGWIIPKGAPKVEASMKFIEFSMQPKQQAIFAEHIAYGPSNSNAFEYIPQARREILPTYAPNLKQLFRADAEWLADNLDELTAAWTRWRAG